MLDYSHNGGDPQGFDVPATGIKIKEAGRAARCIVITNPSATPMYLALKTPDDGVTCPAEVGKGIYLGPAGGAYEINITNMCLCEIWAIHDAAGVMRICVQPCS